MSIIDFKKRHTTNWEKMHNHQSSPDSMLYIENADSNVASPTSIDLNVGDAYIIPGSNHTFAISEKGLVVKPHHAVVIYTKQRIKLPYNVFGVVTGKGTLIFRGCFLSTGKIDPAFDGQLKIGLYNGGSSSICLRTGEAFATAYFINTDATLEAPLKQYQTGLPPDLPQIKLYQTAWMYFKSHVIKFIAWVIIAIPAALYYLSQFIEWLKS